ncbi:hypothetical protein KM043_010852 [Ampulex compressa]|nr:hypothetical protein KM043_010852 [Ampulex compressa]
MSFARAARQLSLSAGASNRPCKRGEINPRTWLPGDESEHRLLLTPAVNWTTGSDGGRAPRVDGFLLHLGRPSDLPLPSFFASEKLTTVLARRPPVSCADSALVGLDREPSSDRADLRRGAYK